MGFEQALFGATTVALAVLPSVFDAIVTFAAVVQHIAARGKPQTPDSSDQGAMAPIYVGSAKELEEVFSAMIPHFEGKESEANWNLREKDILKLRRLAEGNALHHHPSVYLTGNILSPSQSLLVD